MKGSIGSLIYFVFSCAAVGMLLSGLMGAGGTFDGSGGFGFDVVGVAFYLIGRDIRRVMREG